MLCPPVVRTCNCIALSTTSDATGTYNLYDFQLTMAIP